MSQALALALTFGVAFGLAYTATPLVRRLAVRFRFVDRPSARRDEAAKPRLGGVALYLAFLVATVVSTPFVTGRSIEEWTKVLGFLLGATIVVVMGVLDDGRELGPLPQLGSQILGAGVAIAAGITIDQIANPLGNALQNSMFYLPPLMAVGFTLFWIVGAMNTVNFVDGLDGLAAGITIIASGILFIHSFELTQYSIAFLPLALTGAVLGFLPHNFFPARITMGTSGAAFLGYCLGTLSIIGGTKAATVLLVLGVPIIDTAWIILRRIISGRSPFRADRSHLHHRLMELGLSQRQIVVLYCVACGLLGSLALLISSRLLKLYVLLGLGVLLVGILAIVAQKRWDRGG